MYALYYRPTREGRIFHHLEDRLIREFDSKEEAERELSELSKQQDRHHIYQIIWKPSSTQSPE